MIQTGIDVTLVMWRGIGRRQPANLPEVHATVLSLNPQATWQDNHHPDGSYSHSFAGEKNGLSLNMPQTDAVEWIKAFHAKADDVNVNIRVEQDPFRGLEITFYSGVVDSYSLKADGVLPVEIRYHCNETEVVEKR